MSALRPIRMHQVTLTLFHGPGKPFELIEREWDIPLSEGECLVKLSMASVCGSDLHTLAGRRTTPTPCVLGHEGVGRIVALGPGKSPQWLGRRVSWTLADSCGHCLACTDWLLPQKCEQLKKYGHASFADGTGLNGTYASHIVLRAGTHLVPLPDSVTERMAVSANCALATMVAATRPMGTGGGTAVIQGAGLLGLLACALLRANGWQRIVVVDTNPERLNLVSAFGGEPALSSARALVGLDRADAVVEATGRAEVIAEGIDLLRPGGRYQLVGMVHPDSALNLTGEMLIRKCLTLQGTHNYTPNDLAAAVAFLEGPGQTLPWDQLVSPSMPLASIANAMDLAISGRWARVSLAQ